MRRASVTRAWNAFMRQPSLQYFLAGFEVVNSRPHDWSAQRREISSRLLDLREPRWKSSCHAPPWSAHTLDGLYADSRVPQPSMMQMRPAPYVLVFNMSSATLWRLRPRSERAPRCSIVVALGVRLV